jgi:aldehyde dehydrogenase (NAD+)
LVAANIRQEVVQRVADRARSLTVGPGGTDVDVGPLASKAQYDRVLGFISAGEREGAVVAAGGERPAGLEKGYFLSPTVFDAVLPSMSIATDEIFGPVVSTIQFTSEEEAVEIANGVRYGLVSAVYTRDIDRAFRIAKQLHAGQVWVNDWFVGGVQAPTGGYKDSGIGREKGLRALQNYVRVKNIGVRIGGVA